MPRLLRLDQVQQFAAIDVLSDPGAIAGPKIVPSCAQIVLRWGTDSGKTAHNVLYGRYSGAFAGSVAQANSLLSGLTTGAAWTGFAATLTTVANLQGVDIRDVNSPNQALIQSTGAAVPGTGAGLRLPDEVACCVTLRTAFVGPANRGRMYLVGFGHTNVNAGNIIAPGMIAAVNTWVATFTSVLAGQGYTWVIGQPARAAYTGSTGRFHPARTATSTPITSAVVRDNHWDSQRRRGLK